jgi:hypothetical protein
VVIGPASADLVNVLWMSKGSALIEIPTIPIQQTRVSVLAAEIGVEYWVVPELGSAVKTFLPLQVDSNTPEYFSNLLERVLA